MRVLYHSWQEHLEGTGKSCNDPLVMPWLFSKEFRRQNPEKVNDIKSQFTRGYLSRNSRAFERQIRANITHNTRGSLHKITVPVMIMVGRHDDLTPPRLAKEIRSEMPRAELVIFEEGGHGLYWEAPKRFNGAVLDFLKRQA